MKFLQLIGWECRHSNYSRVYSKKKSTDYYVVCHDCGARVPYDWANMKVKEVLHGMSRMQVKAVGD